MWKPAFCVNGNVERREAAPDHAANTLPDGTFQDDTASCLRSIASVELSLTDLEEDDGYGDWDWTEDRPTPTLHHGPPPAPLTCERESNAAPPSQPTTDHAASVCIGRI